MIKLCVNCAHCVKLGDGWGKSDHWRCKACVIIPAGVSPVTGERVDEILTFCHLARQDVSWECGMEGTLWVAENKGAAK